MSNVKAHYDTHLGHFYAWMLGDFSDRRQQQQAYFQRHQILPQFNGVAIDAGAGHGIQSVALSHLGFSVKAIDFNRQLLALLSQQVTPTPVQTIEADFTQEALYHQWQPELLVCMGDTLTHLPTMALVENTILIWSEHLQPKGKLVISFRNLSEELTGTQRFIPVKSDEHRILTCFLEYFPDFVQVTDLLHERQEGQWIQKVSSYQKLRITEDQVVRFFTAHGLALLSSEVIHGMSYLIAQKQP